MDDGWVGTRRGREQFAAPEGWPRAGSRADVEQAVREAGPGAVGFLLVQRRDRIGHALALYHAAPGTEPDAPGGLVYLDPAGGPVAADGSSFRTDHPGQREIGEMLDRAAAVRVLVVDPVGTVRPFTSVPESESTARAILDPSRDPRYGARGGEREKRYQVEGEDGVFARHPHLNLAREVDGRIEVVAVPARMLPAELHRPTPEQVGAAERDVEQRLRRLDDLAGGLTIGELFPAEAGYVVSAADRNRRAWPDPDARYDRVQDTLGVAMPAMRRFLADVLADAERHQQDGSWDPGRDHHRFTATRHMQDALAVADRAGEEYRAWSRARGGRGSDAAVQNVAGHLALTYAQLAVLAHNYKHPGAYGNDYSLVLSRLSPAQARGLLTDDQQEYLDAHVRDIENLVWEKFADRNHELMAAVPGAIADEFGKVARKHPQLVANLPEPVEDLVRRAFASRNPQVLADMPEDMAALEGAIVQPDNILAYPASTDGTRIGDYLRSGLVAQPSVTVDHAALIRTTGVPEPDDGGGRLPLGQVPVELRAYGEHHADFARTVQERPQLDQWGRDLYAHAVTAAAEEMPELLRRPPVARAVDAEAVHDLTHRLADIPPEASELQAEAALGRLAKAGAWPAGRSGSSPRPRAPTGSAWSNSSPWRLGRTGRST
jgi:hypothetical protein